MELINKLAEKLDALIEKYEKEKELNAKLNTELSNLKHQLEEKELELQECKENMALKELELEEVVTKIESILGK